MSAAHELWTDIINGQVLTITQQRLVQFPQQSTYTLYAICLGEPLVLNIYPTYDAMIAGLQGWVEYLKGGGTVPAWLARNIAESFNQYSQTLNTEDAAMAAIKAAGVTPGLARKMTAGNISAAISAQVNGES